MNAVAVQDAFNALSALGSAWRDDWSEFDGRTLRRELESWQALMQRALEGESIEGEADGWLRAEGICPVCHSWREWCSDQTEHWTAPTKTTTGEHLAL